MTLGQLDRLKKLLPEKDWVKGAVNYDEDLHFSTLYLRASCAEEAASLYPGYTSLVAFYEGFNEHYYLLRTECLETAQAIVRRALRRPTWLPGILRAIERYSDALGHVFRPDTTPASLGRLAAISIQSLYRRHAACHRLLYKYARLPEALDRGVSYFSAYLLDHLAERGLSASACEEAFAVLSQPTCPSVLAQELLEFEEIVRLARRDSAMCERLVQSAAKARLFVKPSVLDRLETHCEKWKFLSYHGYGRRELGSPARYLERLVEALKNPAGQGDVGELARRSEQASGERRDLLRRLRLDPAHRTLFEIYPEIGAVKLYRRHAQLRNFYYLDMLLADIARRLGESEWTVRCMLPEEVMASLRAGRLTNPAIRERGGGCLYAILDGREQVLAGSAAVGLRRLLSDPVVNQRDGVLKGTVASRGNVTGPCKIIIRADDCREEFASGTIVVSESTDPDLLPLLRKAGGVLTEQGGVTCHAAIICRELGIPTIVGIDGLLERIHDGDVVEVDANRGIVTPVPEKASVKPPRAMTIDAAPPSPDVIGGKAYNLGLVRQMGFQVPPFVVLGYDRVQRVLCRPSARDRKQLVDWAVRQIGLSAQDKVAVRSSAVQEDREEGSQAGAYRSLLNVRPNEMAAALQEFVKSNRPGKGRASYRGSIIVQRMVEADYAGVCLTRDERIGKDNMVVLEMVAGSNEAVTAGKVQPDRLLVDRLTGDIFEEERHIPDGAPLDIGRLVQEFLTLETRFGKSLDIEWALAGGTLFILQARPIVHQRGERLHPPVSMCHNGRL